MRLVLGTTTLVKVGGSETYLLTVAEQLERLGHEVTVWAPEQGPLVEDARRQRLDVARAATELPEDCDAVLVQDRVVSYSLAERYPEVPQLMVTHTDWWDHPRCPESCRRSSP